jgi:hypothetical protein
MPSALAFGDGPKAKVEAARPERAGRHVAAMDKELRTELALEKVPAGN